VFKVFPTTKAISQSPNDQHSTLRGHRSPIQVSTPRTPTLLVQGGLSIIATLHGFGTPQPLLPVPRPRPLLPVPRSRPLSVPVTPDFRVEEQAGAWPEASMRGLEWYSRAVPLLPKLPGHDFYPFRPHHPDHSEAKPNFQNVVFSPTPNIAFDFGLNALSNIDEVKHTVDLDFSVVLSWQPAIPEIHVTDLPKAFKIQPVNPTTPSPSRRQFLAGHKQSKSWTMGLPDAPEETYRLPTNGNHFNSIVSFLKSKHPHLRFFEPYLKIYGSNMILDTEEIRVEADATRPRTPSPPISVLDPTPSTFMSEPTSTSPTSVTHPGLAEEHLENAHTSFARSTPLVFRRMLRFRGSISYVPKLVRY
jgi:hypothetical protein